MCRKMTLTWIKTRGVTGNDDETTSTNGASAMRVRGARSPIERIWCIEAKLWMVTQKTAHRAMRMGSNGVGGQRVRCFDKHRLSGGRDIRLGSIPAPEEVMQHTSSTGLAEARSGKSLSNAHSIGCLVSCELVSTSASGSRSSQLGLPGIGSLPGRRAGDRARHTRVGLERLSLMLTTTSSTNG